MFEITKKESKALEKIIKLRRDIRGNNFTSQKIAQKDIEKIIQAGLNAPSVGYSQPWKFVIIESQDIRNRVYDNFSKEYDKSKKYFKDRPIYQKLKLEGIKEAPINIAIFYKKSSKKILGQTSQKKMGEYSVVCAVENIWLMARSLNIGIGWVSILKPKKVKKILEIPKEYKLIAYLCVGYVKEFSDIPELKKLHWEREKDKSEIVSWIKDI